MARVSGDVTHTASEFTTPPEAQSVPLDLWPRSFATATASPIFAVTSYSAKSLRHDANHRGEGGPKWRNQDARDEPPGEPYDREPRDRCDARDPGDREPPRDLRPDLFADPPLSHPPHSARLGEVLRGVEDPPRSDPKSEYSELTPLRAPSEAATRRSCAASARRRRAGENQEKRARRRGGGETKQGMANPRCVRSREDQ